MKDLWRVLVVRALQRSRFNALPDPALINNHQVLASDPDSFPAGTGEADIACVPPSPPVQPPLHLPSARQPPDVLGGNGTPASEELQAETDGQYLWRFLQHETYRQRGEGFRSDWAFHVYAARHNLGAPLAPTARRDEQIVFDGKRYGFQPFAHDTLFNEIPQWSQVRSLNKVVHNDMPEGGLARQLLAASYLASGSMLHSNWAFHQVAVRECLGPALSRSYRIKVAGQSYNLQIFARDTLYHTVPDWTDVQRLSTTPAGDVQAVLWAETYKLSGLLYQPDSPFHQYAVRAGLGTPLTGIYQAHFAGTVFNVQVFASDTLYARPGDPVARQQMLPKPASFASEPTPPGLTVPDDALSSHQPVLNILPIAGQPAVAQFYGYTRYAAGEGRRFYQATQGRHSGIDFAVPVGTPLLSVDYGVVVWSGQNVNGISFGAGPRSIIVRYGGVYALYGHTASESVYRGQMVRPGQEIGRSGFPTAPHLHFELRPVPESVLDNRNPQQNPVNPGYAVNPLTYFSADLQAYFHQQIEHLGGMQHFCRGSPGNQDRITFGAPVDKRPCT